MYITRFLISLYCFLQSWDTFFRNASNGLGPGLAYQSPPGIGVKSIPYSEISFANGKAQQHDIDIQQIDIHDLIQDHLAVFSLIRGYQVDFKCAVGHFSSSSFSSVNKKQKVEILVWRYISKSSKIVAKSCF